MTYTFTYNNEGIRTSKSANGNTTTYYYSGGLLIGESNNTETILYIYDAEGAPIGIRYRKNTQASGTWTTYWFEKNLLGDIVAVYSSAGTKLISYKYDAWGNFTSTTHAADSIGGAAKNPFRYRGYYYDVDLGFYVTGTRYYDPVIGRFISPDAYDVITATPTALTDKNLYAYCDNNPVMRVDHGGMFWETLFDVASLVASAADVVMNPGDAWAWVGLVGDVVDLVPFVSGVGEATDLLRFAGKVDDVADAVDDVHDTAKAIDNATGAFESSKTSPIKIHGNSLEYSGTNYGYALLDKDKNILKFGETIHPTTRYSKKYLMENQYSMVILDSGTKREMHLWQHDMNMYYKHKYDVFPPLNRRGW